MAMFYLHGCVKHMVFFMLDHANLPSYNFFVDVTQSRPNKRSLKMNQASKYEPKRSPNLSEIEAYIFKNICEPLQLDELEIEFNVSKFSIIRSFKKHFGITPNKWIWEIRTIYAAHLLRTVDHIRIIDAAVYAGFSSQAHLSRLMKQKFGLTPAEMMSVSENLDALNSNLPLCLTTQAPEFGITSICKKIWDAQELFSIAS
jgi:AraC-like DNA-binding protein